MKRRQAYFLVIFFSLLTFLLATKILVIPATQAASPINISDTGALAVDPDSQIKFKPNITIPNSDFKAGVDTPLDTSDLLSNYIVAIYRYGAILATIVAMFMLVLAGWKWLLAAGSSERINSAKDTISGALVGLAILFGGYLLMSQISTKLVDFGTFSITPVPSIQSICGTYQSKTECDVDTMCEWQGDENQITVALGGKCVAISVQICPADSQVVPIVLNSKFTVTASDPRLMPEANAALQRAVSSLQAGETITITSAYRSWALQKTLYECYINKQGGVCPGGCRSCNFANPPDCNEIHQRGLAVDVCYSGFGVNTCVNQIMDSDYNCIGRTDPPCTSSLSSAETRLRDIMTNAGFDSWSGEWWHFNL